jgi:hypothetical protein
MRVSGRLHGKIWTWKTKTPEKYPRVFDSKNLSLRIRTFKGIEISQNAYLKNLSRKMIGKGKILGKIPGDQTKVSLLLDLA